MVIADACSTAIYFECTGAHKPKGGLSGELLTWGEEHYYVHDHDSLAATYTSLDSVGEKEGARQLYKKVFGVSISSGGSYIGVMQRIKDVHKRKITPWHSLDGIKNICSYDVSRA